MTSGGNNFNDFPENQLTKFRGLTYSIKAIPKMLCFVTIHWSQSWVGVQSGWCPLNVLIRESVPLQPPSPPPIVLTRFWCIMRVTGGS